MIRSDSQTRRSATVTTSCAFSDLNDVPVRIRPNRHGSSGPSCRICGATDDLDFLDLPRCPAGPPSGWYCGPHGMAAIGFLIHRRALARLSRGGVARPLIARSWRNFAVARSEGGAQALNYSLTLERAVRNLLAVIDRDG